MRLDADGLTTETQEQIRELHAAAFKAIFGVNMKTNVDSQMGQLLTKLAETDALVQQAALALYRSIDPNGAPGRALDARLALTGSVRKGATRSSVAGLLSASQACVVPDGSLIRKTADGSLWELTSGDITFPAGDLSDQEGTFTALDSAPIVANAGTDWEVVTVIVGWDAFANPADDATVGRDREQDGPARRTRLLELYSQGQGPLAAITGAVSRVDGVVGVRTYHNPDTAPVDSDGIPFKAFNVVLETTPATPTVETRQAIADVIWSAMTAGGEAFGTDYAETVVDSEGTDQPIGFDLVSEQTILIEIDLVTSTAEASTTPNITDIVTAEVLATAVAEHGVPGRDVLALDYSGIVYAMLEAGTITGVDGVVVRLAIDPDAPAGVTKLDVGIREKADFDSTGVTVIEV